MLMKIYVVSQVVGIILVIVVLKSTKYKKWYCPRCRAFKHFCRDTGLFEKIPRCRSCGTKMLNVQDVLELRDKNYLDAIASKRLKLENAMRIDSWW